MNNVIRISDHEARRAYSQIGERIPANLREPILPQMPNPVAFAVILLASFIGWTLMFITAVAVARVMEL
jgi:hypothetical protein